MEVTRRASTEADSGFARRVHHLAYREVAERQFGPWDEAVQDRFFESGWAAALHEIIECDGTPVGYCSVVEMADHLEVRELVVAPEFQNRGIGSRVLEGVLAHARERNVPVR